MSRMLFHPTGWGDLQGMHEDDVGELILMLCFLFVCLVFSVLCAFLLLP